MQHYLLLTKETDKAFYVGEGTDVDVIINEAKNGYQPWNKEQQKVGIECLFVLRGLSSIGAKILVVCWIHERSTKGEMLLQYVDMPNSWQEHERLIESYSNRTKLLMLFPH